MLKPEDVPDVVVEAFVDTFHGMDMTRKAAIAAAINAWPKMEPTKVLSVRDNGEGYCLKQTGIFLPLPHRAAR